jgi:nucleoside-diphosphate-sugar epimerase
MIADAGNRIEESRCLVTGGAGLVGSHIAQQLAAAGASEVVIYDNLARGTREQVERVAEAGNVRFVEGDIRDSELVRASTEGMDFVFHQAAMWLRECQVHPRDSIDVNVTGTFNVCEAAVEASVKKVVAASSSSVYGDGLYLPTDEGHPFNNDLFYGATKVAGEQLMRSFHKAYGLDYIALRYLNVFGPHQAAGSAYMDVIAHFAGRIEDGLPPRIEGDGSQTLDLVYVADAARANLLALTSPATNEVFNVASGRETTVQELAQTMLRIYDRTDLEPEYVPRDAKLVSRRWGSAEKAREVLGFETEIDVEDGLRRVVESRLGGSTARA